MIIIRSSISVSIRIIIIFWRAEVRHTYTSVAALF